jgi:regulator of replication initiation timing
MTSFEKFLENSRSVASLVERLADMERERDEAQKAFKGLLDEVWQLRADNVVLRDKLGRLERERKDD